MLQLTRQDANQTDHSVSQRVSKSLSSHQAPTDVSKEEKLLPDDLSEIELQNFDQQTLENNTHDLSSTTTTPPLTRSSQNLNNAEQ